MVLCERLTILQEYLYIRQYFLVQSKDFFTYLYSRCSKRCGSYIKKWWVAPNWERKGEEKIIFSAQLIY